MTQRANARGAQPLEEFGNLLVGKSIMDKQRQQHLEDLASERTFETNAAVTASKRRMQEQAETDRLRLIEEYSKAGVPDLKSGDTIEQANSKYQGWQKNRATIQFQNVSDQIGAARQRQEQYFDKIHQIAASPALSAKGPAATQQRIAALRAALNDPSARQIPDSVRANLQAIIASGNDPANAVDQAIEQMKTFSGSKWGMGGNLTEGQRWNHAMAFAQAYTTALAPGMEAGQKADLQAAFQGLADSQKQLEAITQKGYAIIDQSGHLVPAAMRKQWSDTMTGVGPPSDPNTMMGTPRLTTDAGPAFKPPQDEPPAPMITTPSANPASPNEAGVAADFGGRAAASLGPGMAPLAGTIAALASRPGAAQSASDALSGAASAAPGALGALASGGILPAVGAMGAPIVGAVGSGIASALRSLPASRTSPQTPQQLMPATPAEEAQAQAIARLGLKRQGMSDDQATQFIQSEKAKAMAGDQQSIAGHNAILKMVRNANSNPLSGGGVALQGQPATTPTPLGPSPDDNSQ